MLLATVRRHPAQRAQLHLLHLLGSNVALRVVADLGFIPSDMGLFGELVMFLLSRVVVVVKYHRNTE